MFLLQISGIILFILICYAEKEFRFDYEYREQADGWLKYHIVPGTWREARMRCHAEGAVLASPLTHRLKKAMISFVHANKGLSTPGAIYTGVHASFSKGDYTSIEGVPLARLPITWAPGEPDNFENAESCLVMRADDVGSMLDARCEDVLPYVCYKKYTNLTINECGTTDHAYTLDARTGNCYKLHRHALVWSQAFMTCQAEGAYLAIINSKEEAAIVYELFGRSPDSTIVSLYPGELAIGLHDWGERSTFMTIHGQTVDEAGYQIWSGNQPNNATKDRPKEIGQFCGSVGRDAKLNDLWCNVAVPFLSEKEFRFDYEYREQADGWLKYHIVPGTWREARMRCHAEGAVLASPLTHRLKKAMISFVHANKGLSTSGAIYTGVHASFSKGDYTSIEGVPLARLPITWAPGEPDNFENAESCLVMRADDVGSMLDARCEDVLPYVCYKKYTNLTINECGTTDHAYTLDARTGNCYKLHRHALVWSQAFMTCQAEGAYLAIINSKEEAAIVYELFGRSPDSTIVSLYPGELAIGLHDWGERSTFMTIHGQTVEEAGFQTWSGGQPNNATKDRPKETGQFCGSVYRNAKLNDIWCNVPIAFLCEKKPDSLLTL